MIILLKETSLIMSVPPSSLNSMRWRRRRVSSNKSLKAIYRISLIVNPDILQGNAGRLLNMNAKRLTKVSGKLEGSSAISRFINTFLHEPWMVIQKIKGFISRVFFPIA
jgi:hypothetical protein